MGPARKTLRIVRGTMLVSIVFYVFIGERIGKNLGVPPTSVYFAITLVAITTVGMIFAVRRLFVLRAEVRLAAQPDDAAALKRWWAGYIFTYALCEAVALFGFVLRVLGFALSQVVPFYLVGFVLIALFGPRRPANEMS